MERKSVKFELAEVEDRSVVFVDPSKFSLGEWRSFLSNHRVTENVLRKYSNLFCSSCWNIISKHQILSEEFMRDFSSLIYWYGISSHQKLSEDFIIEFREKIYWSDMSSRDCVTPKVLWRCKKEVDWGVYLRSNKMSEEDLRKYEKYILPYINYVVRYQDLTDDFIRDYEDKINWYYLCIEQKLSTKIMEEFSHKLYWDQIALNQPLTKSFILAYADKLSEDSLRKNKNIDKKSLGYGFWKMFNTAKKLCS